MPLPRDADSTKQLIGGTTFSSARALRHGFHGSLSLQSNQGPFEPLMTPQEALLSLSPPTSGHKPKKRETPRTGPFWMLAQEACSSPACGRVSSGPTARLRREEYRLRLKQTTPDAAHRYPLFKSSTAFRPLAPSPLCAVLETKTHVSVWKEKLRPAHFFSPKRNPKIPGEKGEKGKWLIRNGDSH
jgi:hypothetical protein